MSSMSDIHDPRHRMSDISRREFLRRALYVGAALSVYPHGVPISVPGGAEITMEGLWEGSRNQQVAWVVTRFNMLEKVAQFNMLEKVAQNYGTLLARDVDGDLVTEVRSLEPVRDPDKALTDTAIWLLDA